MRQPYIVLNFRDEVYPINSMRWDKNGINMITFYFGNAATEETVLIRSETEFDVFVCIHNEDLKGKLISTKF